jgi:superfamily II DNA/RNA helicase
MKFQIDTSKGKFVEIPATAYQSDNIVIVAPTGSGKTTAVLRFIRTVMYIRMQGMFSEGLTAVVTVPTKPACEDIYRSARSIIGEKLVGIDNSDVKALYGQVRWDKPVMVTPYEKLLFVLKNNPELFREAVVVIDEFHFVSGDRGQTIDAILTLVNKYKAELKFKTKLVLLTATFPQVDEVASYLSKYGRTLWLEFEDRGFKVNPYLEEHTNRVAYFRNPLGLLSQTTIRVVEWVKRLESEGVNPYPVLVYLPNQKASEEMAQMLEAISGGNAVAFHSGLELDERLRIFEELKKDKTDLKYVVATDALAVSVNTPVRSVAIPFLTMRSRAGVHKTRQTTIAQVIGRAGRPGYSGVREINVLILYGDEEEKEIAEQALRGEYEPIQRPKDLIRTALFILSTVGSPEDYAKHSLFGYLFGGEFRENIARAVGRLKLYGIAREVGGRWELSKIGEIMGHMLAEKREVGAIVFSSGLFSLGSAESWKEALGMVLPFVVAGYMDLSRAMSWVSRVAGRGKLNVLETAVSTSVVVDKTKPHEYARKFNEFAERMYVRWEYEECFIDGECDERDLKRAENVYFRPLNSLQSVAFDAGNWVYSEFVDEWLYLIGSDRYIPRSAYIVATQLPDVIRTMLPTGPGEKTTPYIVPSKYIYPIDAFSIPNDDKMLMTAQRVLSMLAEALYRAGYEKPAVRFEIASKVAEVFSVLKTRVRAGMIKPDKAMALAVVASVNASDLERKLSYEEAVRLDAPKLMRIESAGKGKKSKKRK